MDIPRSLVISELRDRNIHPTNKNYSKLIFEFLLEIFDIIEDDLDADNTKYLRDSAQKLASNVRNWMGLAGQKKTKTSLDNVLKSPRHQVI